MSIKKILKFTAVFLFPAVAFADTESARHYVLIPESVEAVMELILLFMSLIAAFYAVKLAALTQGGTMEKTWNLLAVSSISFAMVEVVDALKGFGLLEVDGLAEIFEFVFVLVLIVVFVRTRKQLLAQVMGK